MDMSSAPADAGQEQDLSGGEGEQLPRLSQRCINSAHACAAFLWCRPTSPDRARPPGAAVGDAQPRGDVGAVGTHWRPSEAAFGADVGSIPTRDTCLHRPSGTWRARLPSASRCARLPGEPRRAPHMTNMGTKVLVVAHTNFDIHGRMPPRACRGDASPLDGRRGAAAPVPASPRPSVAWE